MRVDIPECISTPFLYTLGFTLPILIFWRLARLLTRPEVDPIEFNPHKPFRYLRLIWRQILKIFGMYGKFGKRKYWTIALFLIAYIPLFGEDIPTLLGFTYLATFKSGFEVYQTQEQWLKENSGQEADLGKSFESQSRFYYDGYYNQNTDGFLGSTLFYNETILVDRKTKKSIARYANSKSGYRTNPFVSGNWRGFKFWLELSTDPKGQKMAQFKHIEQQFLKEAIKVLEGEE